MQGCNLQEKNFSDSEKCLNVHRAIVREDNDFSTKVYGDELLVDLPLFVRESLCAFLDKEPKADVVTLYQIFYDKNIRLILLKLAYPSSAIRYFIFAVDVHDRKMTSSPPYVNGKWMENNERGLRCDEVGYLIDKPLLSFVDIDRDGAAEIAVKERVHNGNMYDAVITKYFRLNKNDLSVELALAIESKYLFFFDHKCVFYRYLEGEVISVWLDCTYDVPKEIGRIYLDKTDEGYIVSDVWCNEDRFRNMLVTASGYEAEQFLNHSYYSVY